MCLSVGRLQLGRCRYWSRLLCKYKNHGSSVETSSGKKTEPNKGELVVFAIRLRLMDADELLSAGIDNEADLFFVCSLVHSLMSEFWNRRTRRAHLNGLNGESFKSIHIGLSNSKE